MSLTFTSTPERIASKTKTASVYLTPTPSKRKRVSTPAPDVRTRHSMQEIYAWTFKSDAIATCSVKDALDMEEDKQGGMHAFL